MTAAAYIGRAVRRCKGPWDQGVDLWIRWPSDRDVIIDLYSDDDIREWAACYSLIKPSLFRGCMDDLAVLRKALRDHADAYLYVILQHAIDTTP
jgi:hypothetical protein